MAMESAGIEALSRQSETTADCQILARHNSQFYSRR
jgi:hypothetical protein